MNAEKEKEIVDAVALRAFLRAQREDDRTLFINLMTGKIKMHQQPEEVQNKLYDMLHALQHMCDPEMQVQNDDERIAMYAKFGLKVGIPHGRAWHCKTMMVASYDGIPYCMDEHNKFIESGDTSGIRHSILHRELIIERHHEKIKYIHQHLTEKTSGDVWVLAGGGAQLQAFFGCSQGYIGILYLDMENLEEYVDSSYLEAIGNASFTLHIQNSLYDIHFDSFKHPEIEIRKSGR